MRCGQLDLVDCPRPLSPCRDALMMEDQLRRAQKMDAMVRGDPEAAYGPEFYELLIKEMGWRLGR